MNITELRSIIASTIRGIRAKKVKPEQARAVFSGTSQLMGSYRLEMQYRKLSNTPTKTIAGFLPLITNKKS